MISKLFAKKTVASVLSAFAQNVRDLRALAEERMTLAADKNVRIHELMREVEADENEAQAALEAAEKIEDLIGPAPAPYL